ncbi:GxxExxY protein [Hymenobacter metallilatus]
MLWAVHQKLGHSFPALVHQRALLVELMQAGFAHQRKVQLPAYP